MPVAEPYEMLDVVSVPRYIAGREELAALVEPAAQPAARGRRGARIS
jgi:hypothetical protein